MNEKGEEITCEISGFSKIEFGSAVLVIQQAMAEEGLVIGMNQTEFN